MPKRSAGLLVYRFENNLLQVFLIHPGGPFWENKDINSWSIPKGLYPEDETPLDAAKREFKEETGFEVPQGNFLELTSAKQPSGKIVSAWAVQGNFDESKLSSNLFEMQWPADSGNVQKFPEADKGRWFDLPTAKIKILKGQMPFLEELKKILKIN